MHLNDKEKESGEVEDIVENRLLNQQVSKAETLDEAVDQVLSGLVAIIVEDAGFAFIIDVRSYPGRTPEEPDTEKSRTRCKRRARREHHRQHSPDQTPDQR